MSKKRAMERKVTITLRPLYEFEAVWGIFKGWARAHRPMAQGPSAHGPGPIGPKGPLGSPGETPLGSQGTPPGIPRDPLKSLFFKNRFFKKISVMLHQWVFYRTYPYDNTIFDNDFSRIFIF